MHITFNMLRLKAHTESKFDEDAHDLGRLFYCSSELSQIVFTCADHLRSIEPNNIAISACVPTVGPVISVIRFTVSSYSFT